jgi:hypothetical protein
MWNSVSLVKRGAQFDVVWQQGAEENVWQQGVEENVWQQGAEENV